MIKPELATHCLQLLLKVTNRLQHKMQCRLALIRMWLYLPGIKNKAGQHLSGKTQSFIKRCIVMHTQITSENKQGACVCGHLKL
jgi:hypothetical protein